MTYPNAPEYADERRPCAIALLVLLASFAVSSHRMQADDCGIETIPGGVAIRDHPGSPNDWKDLIGQFSYSFTSLPDTRECNALLRIHWHILKGGTGHVTQMTLHSKSITLKPGTSGGESEFYLVRDVPFRDDDEAAIDSIEVTSCNCYPVDPAKEKAKREGAEAARAEAYRAQATEEERRSAQRQAAVSAGYWRDPTTGYLWTPGVGVTIKKRKDAIAACQSRNVNGLGGWQLPTIDDLLHVDYSGLDVLLFKSPYLLSATECKDGWLHFDNTNRQHAVCLRAKVAHVEVISCVRHSDR